jgi:3-oxoacyl-[acyl-carrier protein] reductase
MAWQIDLNGKCGIVTGAASGIGKAAALHLAAMGAGVALVDISPEGLAACAEEIRAAGGPCALAVPADAADEHQVAAAVSRCLAECGAVDFLVNGHGILRRTPFLEIPSTEWDLMFAVNLKGCFLFCKAVLPHMKACGRGAIVNVASLAGRTCSVLGGAHYTAAKHGLVGLSRHLAREVAPFGIRVNAFCPGATMTPMIVNATPPEEIARVAAALPRGRWASPAEQAWVIGFLLSDAAANITGASIDSNGGALMI